VPKPVCDTFFNYTFTHEDTRHDPQLQFFSCYDNHKLSPHGYRNQNMHVSSIFWSARQL